MNETEHLLTCLNEESVEIAKDVDKSLRFGLDDVNFLIPDGPTNRQRLIDELNDFVGVLELLQERNIIPDDWLTFEKVEAKKKKVIDCMEYARSVGALSGKEDQ